MKVLLNQFNGLILIDQFWCFQNNIPGQLNNYGRATHMCFSKPTITGSDNGLSPGWRQAIIQTNAGMLSIEPGGTNFSEI